MFGNRHRTEKLARCRHLLGMPAPAPPADEPPPPADYRDRTESLTGVSLRMCPVCQTGHMIVFQDLPRGCQVASIPDTS